MGTVYVDLWTGASVGLRPVEVGLEASSGRSRSQAPKEGIWSSRSAAGPTPAELSARALFLGPPTDLSDYGIRRDIDRWRPRNRPAFYTCAPERELGPLLGPEQCCACALREQCTKATQRSLSVPPDLHDRRRRERLARSSRGRRLLRQRVCVEHAIGRLKQRGSVQSRYLGTFQTHFQWLWTATAVRLSKIWSSEALVPA